jgi:hypothetical protein
MKTKMLPLLVFIILATACQKNATKEQTVYRSGIPAGYTNCGESTERTILAGQTTNTGSVTVWNDENNLYVYYQATGNYLFKKTHLYVGFCNTIPVNNGGNPRIGLYPYNNDHGAGVSSFLRVIPLNSWTEGTSLCVSAHAEVVAYGSNGSVTYSQTGWGQGAQINDGGSWAMKFEYTIQSCLGDPGGEIR